MGYLTSFSNGGDKKLDHIQRHFNKIIKDGTITAEKKDSVFIFLKRPIKKSQIIIAALSD